MLWNVQLRDGATAMGQVMCCFENRQNAETHSTDDAAVNAD